MKIGKIINTPGKGFLLVLEGVLPGLRQLSSTGPVQIAEHLQFQFNRYGKTNLDTTVLTVLIGQSVHCNPPRMTVFGTPAMSFGYRDYVIVG